MRLVRKSDAEWKARPNTNPRQGLVKEHVTSILTNHGEIFHSRHRMCLRCGVPRSIFDAPFDTAFAGSLIRTYLAEHRVDMAVLASAFVITSSPMIPLIRLESLAQDH
jgi:hypothetical protein